MAIGGGGSVKTLVRIGVLASGRGSNFEALLRAEHSGDLGATVAVLLSDHADAGAIEIARRHGIPAQHLQLLGRGRIAPEDEAAIVRCLRAHDVGLVCMAGFMRLVGRTLLEAFPGAVLNIHPSLLPSFPGLHATEQAVAHGVKVSGCTVHIVTHRMDAGPIVAQVAVPVHEGDSGETLASRILEQEHLLYPQAVRWWAERRLAVSGRMVHVLPAAAAREVTT